MENNVEQKNTIGPDTIAHLDLRDKSDVPNNVDYSGKVDYFKYLSNDIEKKIKNNSKENDNQKIQRKIYVDLQEGTELKQPEKYCDNSVRTTQYTIITFLPFAILNQYKNPFNIFFLIGMIIDCIPAISSVSATTTIMPVVVILIINLIREAVEDYRKYLNDKLTNEKMNYVYKLPKFLIQKCHSINVGNVIRVKKNETIPADLLIIKTSLKNGFCYMQTANLDGETALQPREAINLTQQKLKYESPKTFKNLLGSQNENCYIEVDVPSENIYEINGTIIFKGEKIYFDSKNILLKGSRLKSVDYTFGIAIYTGKDTKLMKNINRTKLKQSDIDKILLYIIIFLIGILVLFTIINSIIGIVDRNKGLPDYEDNDINESYIYYYRKGESKKNALEIIRIFAAHFHLSTVIPISIMILNIVIKVFQSAFLEFSPQYMEDPDDKIKCYSTTLIEQLGKVKYIFSDKTGTLTKNQMIFKGCSIFTNLFDGTISNTGKVKKQKRKYMPLPSGARTILSSTQRAPTIKVKNGKEKANSHLGTTTSLNTGFSEDEIINDKSKITPNFCFDYFFKCLYDKEAKTNLKIKNEDKSPFMTLNEAIKQFLLNIATNHDVLVEKRTEKDNIIYQGISPDEITLVSMADELGYTFLSRENEKIIIEIYDYEKNEKELKEFQILKKFDFTPERQSSSIIVRDLETNKIFLYIKGSDRKITKGIDSFSIKYIYEPTQEHVDEFAHKGLRTLCYSFKSLDESEYNTWSKEYDEIKYIYQSTKDKSLKAELDKVIDKIESNAILLGATALEDRLQDKVKRDIEDFIEADINFWMITGDKMDTAETIGQSCGIISEDSEVFKIRESKDAEQVLKQLEEIKKNIAKSDKELESIIQQHNKKLKQMKNNEKKNNPDIINKDLNSKNIENNEMKGKNNNKNEEVKLTVNNAINNPQLTDNYINREYQLNATNLSQKNANHKSFKIHPEIQRNDNNISNQNISDKKTEISNNKSENSSNYTELIDYFHQLEEGNLDYLDEISNIQKNEEIVEKANILKNKKNEKLNSNGKEYIRVYDYFQNKLNEYSKKTKNRCFLFKMKYIYPQPDKIYAKNEKITCKYTLIIEGSSINTCIDNEEISKIFYELIKDSRSLICCRSSPSQKSKIVNFMKKNSDGLTLAIGDGGNDVNMIKAAHVGIGIFGKEGYQAAYNSDYAISQFKYLKRLLFVDGRFSLKRNSYFIYYYFFKNVLYSISQFWFQIFSKFSGRSLMDDWYSTCFNSFFTVVPLAVRAAVEEDFDADFINYSKSEKKKLPYLFPDIYKEFRESKPFNIVKFIFIYMSAFFISIVFFIIPSYSFYKGSYGTRGIVYSFWDVSLECIFCIVITHFAMVFQDTFLYVKFTIFWYTLQIIVNIIVLVVINEVNTETGIDDALWFIMGNLNFWLTLLLLCGLFFIPFFILRNAEFFFGGFIVNLILQNKIDNLYLIKYCQKKVDEMTRINRRVMKFMKLYNNPEEAKKVDNYADKQTKKILDEFKRFKKEKKHNLKKLNNSQK